MRGRLSSAFLLASLTFAAAPARADDELTPFARAIDANPDDAKTYEAFGTKALVMARYDEAIARLKIGVARIPDFGNGYYMLAYALRKKQMLADAADYYRRRIAPQPK